MKIGRRLRAVLLVTLGLMVGYFIGPPIVHAATQLVTIQGAGTWNQAKVTRGGRLLVADQGKYFRDGSLFTFALTEPSGEQVLTSGSSSVASQAQLGDIVGISVDVYQAGSSAVTVRLRRGTTIGTGQIIWQVTVPAAGHTDYTFGQSILIANAPMGFNVEVVNAGGALLQYEVYGGGFGIPCCLGIKRVVGSPRV
jgi:hypothetical protein